MNGYPIQDVIDYMYNLKGGPVSLDVQRGGRKFPVKIKRDRAHLGIELKPFRVKICKNKCTFCFISQLPKGMRKSLYVKDDDYRLSFLYGNYITLANLTRSDKRRIFRQRLSPLYVSVHTTNNNLRRKMLGNPKAPDIMDELKELTSNRIRIHAQIVLCPGLNDGKELLSTIRDLQRFYPYVASVAVVPVGVTKLKKAQFQAFTKTEALNVIETLKKIRRRFKKRHGDPLVYPADEFYILADIPFPSLNEYGDLAQIENGVGMVPSFLSAVKKLKLPKRIDPVRVALFSGTSFSPYLGQFVSKLESIEGLKIELFTVENRFFGQTVTVSGLLTAKDILKSIIGNTNSDILLVPDVALDSENEVFIDNVRIHDMEESLGIPVRPVESSPEGLLKGIISGNRR
jgi:putative radical SAM enzyme (TIGR03279 family)